MRPKTDEILRWPDVRKVVKLCRTTITKLERAGRFPERCQLTDYTVGWRRSDVMAWVAGKRDWSPAPASRIA